MLVSYSFYMFYFLSHLDILTLNTGLLLLTSLHVLATLCETCALREDQSEAGETQKLISDQNHDAEIVKLTKASEPTNDVETKEYATMRPKGSSLIFELLRNQEFRLVAVYIVISTGVDRVFLYNLGTYGRSFGLEDSVNIVFKVGCAVAMCSSVIIGVLVHAVKNKGQGHSDQDEGQSFWTVFQYMYIPCVSLLLKTLMLGSFIFAGVTDQLLQR